MNRPRKQTYVLIMYLNKVKDGDISNELETQRRYVWTNEQLSGLVYTVLTDDYIPPIVLGEVDNSQLWIVDGGQRSASLSLFRYGNYKITSAIKDFMVPYKKKIVDERGNIIWEDAEFDIRNKTYDKLPEELKKRFDEYQLETVIDENCTARRLAQLVKRYNNHTSMNSSQKAFTFVDNFAKEVRDILENPFFLDCGVYTEKERNKGVLERVVLESVMCMFHFDNWKKQPKQVASYLNENSSIEEFNTFKSFIERLGSVITEDLRDMFSSKDSFLWFTMFDKFSELGLEDGKFAEFLRAFKGGLKTETIDDTTFVELDENRGTKDRAVIAAKLSYLNKLMCQYFGINQEFLSKDNILSFVKECVDTEINNEDIELYSEMVEDLADNAQVKNIVLKNKPSVIAIIAYACMKDMDLDGWFNEFLLKIEFSQNQKENYMYMKQNLEDVLNVSA